MDVIIIISPHLSSNENVKGTVLGTHIEQYATYSKICSLIINDPCKSMNPDGSKIFSDVFSDNMAGSCFTLLLNESSLDRKTGATWWLQPRMDD